jgi:hypothetical protein
VLGFGGLMFRFKTPWWKTRAAVSKLSDAVRARLFPKRAVANA